MQGENTPARKPAQTPPSPDGSSRDSATGGRSEKLILGDRFLPRLRLQTHLSLHVEGLHCTSGLGPHHPLIRDWHAKRQRQRKTSAASPSKLTQHHSKYTSSESNLSPQNSSGETAPTSRKINLPIHSKESGIMNVSSCEIRSQVAKPLPGTKSGTTTGSFLPSSGVGANIRESITSLASVSTASLSAHERKSPSSLPSLPLIHTSKNTAQSESTSLMISANRRSSIDSSTCLQTRPAQCESLSLQQAKKKKRRRRKRGRDGREGRCSVINLRIPFGKVEEWDVPQPERRVADKDEDYEDKLKREECASEVDNTASTNPSTLRRLEFIVFSDLPKQPLPSTSTLVASIMHPHSSPSHSSHHHTSNTLHWLHNDHTHPTANGNSHSCTVGKTTCTAADISTSDSTTLTHDQANADSITPANTTRHRHDADLITQISTPTHHPNNEKANTFTNDSETNLNAPNISTTSFEFTSQQLPHTLRYRHPNSRERRSSLPSHLTDHSTDYNHSMSITAYHTTSRSHRNHHSRRISTSHVNQTPVDVGATPSLTSNDVTGPTAIHSSPAKPSRIEQITSKSTSITRGGTVARSSAAVVGERNYCSRQKLKKKHSETSDFSYPDPLCGCSSRYHHRLLRLAALVSDTLTHEHNKKKHKGTHSQ